MAQRQEREEHVRRTEGDRLRGALDVAAEVVVRQHDPLGVPRRPRRIDDREEVFRPHHLRRGAEIIGVFTFECLSRPHDRGIAGSPGLPREPLFPHHDCLFQRGDVSGDLRHLVELELVRYDRKPDCGVVEYVFDLLRRHRRIDGDAHGSEHGDRLIGHNPFGPVFRYDGDAIPPLHSEGPEAEGKQLDLPPQLGVSNAFIGAFRFVHEYGLFFRGEAGGEPVEHLGNRGELHGGGHDRGTSGGT